MAIEAVGVFVGRIGLFGLIGVVPLLLVVGGWRRRPRLTIQVRGDVVDGTVCGPRQRWPVAAERIVANERAHLTEHLEAHEKLSKNLPLSTYDFGSLPASDRAYQDTRATFLAEVDEYCEGLGAWLSEYERASGESEATFRLQFSVRNGENWASHAEGVRLEISLPPGVRRLECAPSIARPPEAPDYQPPPRQPGLSALTGYAGRLAEQRFEPTYEPPDLTRLLTPVRESRPSAWSERDDGSRVWAEVGGVYVGGLEDIDEELILQITEPSALLEWRLFFKGGSTRGSLLLKRSKPRAIAVPAFGRLAGLLRYPDVVIVDDDGDVIHEKRTSDPPLTTPAAQLGPSSDWRDRIRNVAAVTEWDGLGLDPAHDGESTVVRVGKAQMRRPLKDDGQHNSS